MRSQAEFRLQCVVVELLRLRGRPGLYYTHIPNGESRSARTGARLKRMGVRRGAPDLLLIWQGRAIGLELKAEKGRQSPDQRATEQDWTDAGGLYFVAHGYEEAVGFLEAQGVIEPVRGVVARFAPRREAEAA